MSSDLDTRLSALAGWESVDEHFADVAAFVDAVGTEAARAAAQRWIGSPESDVESVGFDVLGELAERDEEVWTVLLAEAERALGNASEEVRWSAAVAVGRRVDSRAVPLWLRFARDADADVRQKAMAALPLLFDPAAPDERIVSALLAGFEDTDADVRDWAALGLGPELGVDTPELRDALARHLDDEGADTAGEAAVGLGGRGDERVLPVLRDWLVREDVGDLWVEAAGELGDPRLLPLLERLRERGWEDDEAVSRPHVLSEAIERCRGALGRD
jgi:HEAT repeat protein